MTATETLEAQFFTEALRLGIPDSPGLRQRARQRALSAYLKQPRLFWDSKNQGTYHNPERAEKKRQRATKH